MTKDFDVLSSKTSKKDNIILFPPLVNFKDGWRLFKYWKNILSHFYVMKKKQMCQQHNVHSNMVYGPYKKDIFLGKQLKYSPEQNPKDNPLRLYICRQIYVMKIYKLIK